MIEMCFIFKINAVGMGLVKLVWIRINFIYRLWEVGIYFYLFGSLSCINSDVDNE